MMYPIGQFFVGGFEGTSITPEVKTLIKEYQIGGFVLFRRNIESVKQVKDLIAGLQKLSKIPLFIGVDQEGGNVFRLGPPFTVLPPMVEVGDYYRRTGNLRKIFKLGRLLGSELKAVGFNWDFAPVVDVHSNPNNPIIGKRSFSPDPKIVTVCAEALIKGLHREGVLSCAKHFPGHGATSVDSHLDLPVLDDPGRLLWKRDLYPYRKLVDDKVIKTIMTAHVRYPDLDPHYCATLSRPILTHLLRGRLKYKGLIVSDDLFMKAISDRYGVPEATRLFFEAGGDIALICKDPEIQMEAIELTQKLLKLDDELREDFAKSAIRIERLKKRFCKPAKQADLKVIGCQDHKALVEKIKPPTLV